VSLSVGTIGDSCVIQLSKFLNHTLATHNQVDSFFENINHNDGKGESRKTVEMKLHQINCLFAKM
jgi:hypothetical protein